MLQTTDEENISWPGFLNRSVDITTATKEITAELPNRARATAGSEWAWIGLICSLLVLAGAHRYWRDWYFQSLAQKSEVSPFPLKDFPRHLNQWKSDADKDESLEPDIVWISGAKDYLVRTYVDEESGPTAVVMIIYGPATKVFAHTPDVCYPAIGCKPEGSPTRIDIPRTGTADKAHFLKENFVKYKPGERDYREVYHSFRNAGEWDVNMYRKYKTFRYNPGMYKVQVQIQGSSSETNNGDDPVIQLLTSIVRELDQYASGNK